MDRIKQIKIIGYVIFMVAASLFGTQHLTLSNTYIMLFNGVMLGAFIFYVLLDMPPWMKWIKKVVGYLIAVVLVSYGAHDVGLTYPFIIIFNGFVFVAFVIFILIDLPPLKHPETTFGRFAILIGTFILGGSLYGGVGRILPQFNPKFEIEKINKIPYVRLEPGPELIAAGRELFLANKCVNCHKAGGMGSSNRGPNMDLWQFGLQKASYLKAQIIDPRMQQAHGFDDEKSKKAMPTYFREEISDDEFEALLAFLGTLWNKEKMPMRGKMDSLVPWNEDPEMVAQGKKVFEGETYDDVNCSVCHGKDGVPLIDGARDLRNGQSVSRNHDRIMKDWTYADWFKSVSEGVPGSPMEAFLELNPARAVWLAIAYDSGFHKRPENQNLEKPEELESVEDLWG